MQSSRRDANLKCRLRVGHCAGDRGDTITLPFHREVQFTVQFSLLHTIFSGALNGLLRSDPCRK